MSFVDRTSIRTRLLVAVLSTLMIGAVMALVPTARAYADDNPATQALASTCGVVPSSTPAGMDQSGVQGAVPGELVTVTHTVEFDEGTIFQDILVRPDGTTYWASYIETLSLDSDLVVDGSSAALEIDGLSQTLVAGTQPDATDFVLVTDGPTAGVTTWQVLFPGDVGGQTGAQTGSGEPSYTVPAGGQTFVFSFEVMMPTDAAWGEVFDAAECFTSVSTGPSNRDTDRTRAAVSAIIPELELVKETPLANAYQAGTAVPYTITANLPDLDKATQTLLVAPARDVVVVDTLPTTLIPLDAAGNTVADGGTTVGGGVWNLADRTVMYPAFDLLPGNTWSVDEEMRIVPGTPATTEITNVVEASISYLPGVAVPNDTIVDPAATDDATVTVASDAPAVNKEADVERYGTDLPITYTVTVDLPAGSSYENFTISDTLPDGMTFISYDTATCTPVGADCPDPITSLTPTVFPGGGTVIGWYPNELVPSTVARQFVFTYQAEIDPEYGNGDPVEFLDSFTNDATVSWNTVDRLGDVPPSTAALPDYDGATNSSDDVIYDRPILNIDKTALTSDGDAVDMETVPWDYQPGDTVTYSAVITNVGSRDATNLAIADVNVAVGIDVSTVSIDGSACGDCVVDPASGALSFSHAGPIAPGDSVVVNYDAEPTDTGMLTNTIGVPTYDDDLGTTYTENPEDTVNITVPDPVLVIDKSTPSSAPNAYGTTVGTEIDFTFTVSNDGPATAYNVLVTDLPPLGTCNFGGSLVPQAGITEVSDGQWQLDAPLDPGESFSFDAAIEICGDIEATDHLNEVRLTWEDTGDGVDSDGNAYEAMSDEPFLLAEPEYEVQKFPAVDGGATINFTLDPTNPNQGAWTIWVTNTSEVPTGGLVLSDPMPETFEYLPGDASIVWVGQPAATFEDLSSASGTTVLAGHTELVEIEIGQLQPGGTARITIPFSHNGVSPSDGVFSKINTVQVRNDNIDFDPEVHEAQGEYTLVPVEKGPNVEKTTSETPTYTGDEAAEGAPGATRYFHIDLTLPGDPINPANPLTAHDLMVADVLPDGLKLPTTEPAYGAEGGSQPAGWNVVCISGACLSGNAADQPEFAGAYLGSAPSGDDTEILWWFGDYTNTADSVYRITFPVEIETEFASGMEVIDGVNEPMVNSARPLFNRDVDAGSGASGDAIPGLPASAPDPRTDFDRAYPKDRAEIDVVTPRLDIEKQGIHDGAPVFEIEVGDLIEYSITITNRGSGPAYDVQVSDDLGVDLGVNRMTVDQGSLAVDLDGTDITSACSFSGTTPLTLDCDIAGPVAGDPDGFTGPALGGVITITYNATPLPSADILSPVSANNWDSDLIRNEVVTPSYFEVPAAGRPADANEYSTGQAVVRTFVYTPAPEIEAGCWGDTHAVPVGEIGQFQVILGNGDGHYQTDYGNYIFSPPPSTDSDGDGRIDVGVGYNPELRLTLPDIYTFVSASATGPGPLGSGDATYATYGAFPDPDQIIDNGDGTQTLIWDPGTINDIPPSPNNYTPYNFKPEYRVLIDVTRDAAGPTWIEGKLWFEDNTGERERGSNSGEYFEYYEEDRNGCPGPAPDHHIEKRPDVIDNVRILPDEVKEFTITLRQEREAPVTGNRFVDTLPHGLDFVGDPTAGDPDYVEATISPVPAGWDPLETYFVSATTDGNGQTEIVWDAMPELPEGNYVVTIPVRGQNPPPFPNDWLTNNFDWQSDQGDRDDPGNMFSIPFGNPVIDKRVDKAADLFGEFFTYTIEVTIPAAFEGNDVTIRDYINWRQNRTQADLDVWGNNQAWPEGDNAVNFYADRHPIEFVSYNSATCLTGCTGLDAVSGVDDTIAPVGLAPLPFVDYDPNDVNASAPNPRGGSIVYHSNENNVIGWYLGDIEQDPQGQDRVIEMTYTVKFPEIYDMREVYATRAASRITAFPGGALDPQFDEEPWLSRLSEYHQPNIVILDHHGAAQDTWFDTADLANDDQWWRFMATNAVAETHATAAVAYPIVVPTKDCYGLNGTQKPDVTPVGTPNVECTVTLTNTSPVPAYDITFTDTPDTECNRRLRHIDGWWHGSSWGSYACDIGGETVNHPNLATPANSFPATWEGIELDPDEQATFTYSLRVDGWTEWTAWDFSHDYESGGGWSNQVVMSPWSDEPGGDTIGAETTISETVGFVNPRVNIFKFPYVNPIPDTRPFNTDYVYRNITQDPTDPRIAGVWPYLHGTPGWQDPLGGNAMEGGSTTDWLQPPLDMVDEHFHWPFHYRTRQRFAFPSWSQSSWLNWTGGGENSWYLPQNDPASWSEDYLVDPGESYSWIIDVFTEQPDRIEQLTITDTLPYGWTYVPGSARMVDGTWLLSRNDGPEQASVAGLDVGYDEIPLRDPVVTAGVATDCNASLYHDRGPELTWQFLRDVPGQDEFWDIRYVDGRDWERQDVQDPLGDRYYEANTFDKINDHVIIFDTMPDPSIVQCDPDHTDADPFFMENNVSIAAVRDYDGVTMNDSYAQGVPVPTPVALSKTPDDDYIQDDTNTEFTITFTNNLDVPVTDLTLDDTLSIVSGVAPQPGSGYTCGTATADGGTGFVEASCVTTGSPTTQWVIEWFFDEVAPGETVTITMPIYAPVDEANGLRYDNMVSTTVKEYHDVFLDDPGRVTVINPSPPQVPTKSANPNPATVNDVVEYTVSWVAHPTMIFADLAYYDLLPDGLTFIDYGEVSCTGQCPAGYSADDVIEMTPVPNADGSTTLMWWFGNMPGSAAGATWSMTYTARVDDAFNDGTTIVDGDSVDNEVIGYSNEESLLDEPTVIPDPSIWTTYPPSDPVNETLDVREPELEIRKASAPSSTPTDGSSTVVYTVEVENTGVMNAYAVVVTDTPNGALENITMDATTYAGSFVTRGWTSIDPTVGWFIADLAPGDIATFTYTAEVIDDFLTAGYPAAENLVTLESFRARPGLVPEDGDRIYEPGLTADTSIPLVGPEISLDKFVGGCTSELEFIEPNTPVTWCIQVTNDGAAPAYGLEVQDTLPYLWAYDAGSTTGANWAVAEPTTSTVAGSAQQLEWSVGDLAAGETVEIRFTAQADDDAPLNVTNWASVESFTSTGDPLPVEVTGARSEDPAAAAMGDFALEIAKLPDVQQDGWQPGEQVSWDIVITNPASETTNTNLVVTDLLPAPLVYDSFTVSPAGAATLNNAGTAGAGAGGTTEIVWDIASLDAGDSITLTLTADVPGVGDPNPVTFMEWYVNDVQVVSDEVVDLVANQAKARWYEPASLGDYTWIDADADGAQDPGETPVDGVTVNLLDAAGNQLYRDPATGAITTDASAGYPAMTTVTGDDPSTTGTVEEGWYTFDNLPPGSYAVEFVPPAGMTLTFSDQGGDDATDSDADRVTGQSHVVTLAGGDHDPTIDAGFIQGANEVGDYTWIDADQDGVQDPGETPLDGVTVNLIGPGPDGVLGSGDDIVLQTTTTGDDPSTSGTVEEGWYEFTGLPDGEYLVEFVLDATNPDHDDLVPTWENGGSATTGDAGDASDSDANRGTGLSHVVDLDSAGTDPDPVVDPTVDAGWFEDADAINEIGDFTWIDTDQDGVQDAGEVPIAGVIVELFGPGPDGVFGGPDDVLLATTTTDASGYYEFTQLPDGEYQVGFSLDPTNPAHDGFGPTWSDQGTAAVGDAGDAEDSDADRATGRSHVIDLDSAGTDPDPVVDPTIDAGFIPDAVNEIGDYTWIDADQNGVQDAGETPLEGVIVDLYGPGPDGVFGTADDVLLQSTTTDASGFYEFTNLPDGEYQVDFTLDPANEPTHATLVPTWENQGSAATGDAGDAADSDANRNTGLSHIVDLDSAGTDPDSVVDPTVDAGWFDDADAINEIGDYTWIDADGDGVQDAGEAPLEGVMVELIDPVTGNVIATTTTDASGFYEFTDLPDGEYQVRFTLDPTDPVHATLAPTAENQGGDDAADSDANVTTGLTHVIDLDSAGVSDDPVVDPTIDAGFVEEPGVNSIGDYTWVDADENGVQDAGETPLEGVIVDLYAAGPDGIIGTADDILWATTTTDASGFYEFTNLPDGEYQVDFTLDPANEPTHATLVPTWENQDGDDAADSDANRQSGLSHVVDLDSAGASDDPINDPTVDAGFFDDAGAVNEIGDYTWIDADGDGVQDAGEAPLEGVMVELIDPVTGNVIATTTTDASGFYEFTDLPDGEYQVRFTLDPSDPAHMALVPTWSGQGGDDTADSDADRATGLTHVIDLDSAGASDDPVVDPTVDAGYRPDPDAVNEIGDYTWIDVDQDGVQDPGEASLEGVIVDLYTAGPDGMFGTSDDVLVQSTTTDASGFYEFTDLPDGEYQVEFTLDPVNEPSHATLVPTWENQGSSATGDAGDATDSDTDRSTGRTAIIDLDSAGTSTEPVIDPTVDAGWFDDAGAVNSIGDYTWIDADGDGVQDAGEAPLEGVMVELIDPVTGNVIATTTTDASGFYEFTDLPDGEYQVRFELDPDNPDHDELVGTRPNQGSDDAADSDADPFTGLTGIIDLDSAGTSDDPVNDPTVDAGFTEPASIGDYVWHDADVEGDQDPDEDPIEGVIVELWGPGPDGEFGGSDDVLIETTVTDADGAYEFDELPPGDYQVRFDPDSLPDGWLISDSSDCDCSAAADSDADTTTGWTSAVTLGPGERNPDIDMGAHSASDAESARIRNLPPGPLAFTGRETDELVSIAVFLMAFGLLLAAIGANRRREEDATT